VDQGKSQSERSITGGTLPAKKRSIQLGSIEAERIKPEGRFVFQTGKGRLARRQGKAKYKLRVCGGRNCEVETHRLQIKKKKTRGTTALCGI